MVLPPAKASIKARLVPVALGPPIENKFYLNKYLGLIRGSAARETKAVGDKLLTPLTA